MGTYNKVPFLERTAIIALSQEGKSQREIGRILGLSHGTVGNVLSRTGNEQIERAIAKKLKTDLAGEMRKTASLLVHRMQDSEVIEKANLRDLAISAGVMIDKARLEEGESTQNIQNVLLVLQSQLEDREKKRVKPVPAGNDTRSDITDITPILVDRKVDTP